MKVHCEVCGKKRERRRAVCIVVDSFRRWICRACVAKNEMFYFTKPNQNDEVLLTGFSDFETRQEELELLDSGKVDIT